MGIFKRLLFLAVVFSVAPVLVMGQQRSTSSNQEMSVEQSYLHQSVEIQIIREMSRAETREMKLVALDYITNAIEERDNKGEEIRTALEFLATEGTTNIVRQNGRMINNFPDIRRKAAFLLGKIGTEEAKDALIKMVLADTEPMVITEAIKSLSVIGLNENQQTVQAISWVVNRYDVLKPDDLLAISAIEAFEKLAEANGSIDPAAIRTIIRIADGHYNYRVKERALLSLNGLREYRQE